MRIAASTFLVLLLVPASPRAAALVTRQTGAPDADVQAMVDAERAFNKKAADTNIRDAFYENFSDESIIFRPGPVNGKEFYAGRPANPGPVLTWWPTYAELSSSGDFGWTTGPWEYRSAKDKPAEAFGHFATVWKREQGNKWRVLIDEGHSCEKPPNDSLTWARGTGKVDAEWGVPKLGVIGSAVDSLNAADRGYSAALAAQGIGAALAAYGDEDVLLYREEKPAIVGAQAAGKALAHEWDGGVTTWRTQAGAISRTLDLAYTYGTAELPPHGKEKVTGRKVFRIWRRAATGPWKLAFDATNPMPPPPAKKP